MHTPWTAQRNKAGKEASQYTGWPQGEEIFAAHSARVGFVTTMCFFRFQGTIFAWFQSRDFRSFWPPPQHIKHSNSITNKHLCRHQPVFSSNSKITALAALACLLADLARLRRGRRGAFLQREKRSSLKFYENYRAGLCNTPDHRFTRTRQKLGKIQVMGA